MRHTLALALAASILAATASAQTHVYDPREVMTDCKIIPGQCQTFYPDGTVVTNYTTETTDKTATVPVQRVDVALIAGNVPLLQPTFEPLFHVGMTIGVVWDCVPEQFAPPGTSPCYNELLHITGVWPEGWLKVLDETGDEWFVNSARMLGFKVIQGLQVVQR